MQENKEIKALLSLIDDPDNEVNQTVTKKIISLGKEILPNLENYWENTTNPDLQEKIELLIEQLYAEDTKNDFRLWHAGKPDLLSGALLISKYVYPTFDTNFVFKEIEKLRRNLWLEMNSFLTPMEQINVLSSIVYSYYKMQGLEVSYSSADGFLLNKTLEKHKGNAFGNGTVLLILCHLLDIPVYAINIPNQFILGYFDKHYEVLNPKSHASEKIKFFIDPVNGQMYSHKDVENYFKKIALPPVSAFFRPFDNTSVIITLLQEIKKCYSKETAEHKINDIEAIIAILIT